MRKPSAVPVLALVLLACGPQAGEAPPGDDAVTVGTYNPTALLRIHPGRDTEIASPGLLLRLLTQKEMELRKRRIDEGTIREIDAQMASSIKALSRLRFRENGIGHALQAVAEWKKLTMVLPMGSGYIAPDVQTLDVTKEVLSCLPRDPAKLRARDDRWLGTYRGLEVQIALLNPVIRTTDKALAVIVWFRNGKDGPIEVPFIRPFFSPHGNLKVRNADGKSMLSGECRKKHAKDTKVIPPGNFGTACVDALAQSCYKLRPGPIPPGRYTVQLGSSNTETFFVIDTPPEKTAAVPAPGRAPDRSIPEIALALSLWPGLRQDNHPHGHAEGGTWTRYSLYTGAEVGGKDPQWLAYLEGLEKLGWTRQIGDASGVRGVSFVKEKRKLFLDFIPDRPGVFMIRFFRAL